MTTNFGCCERRTMASQPSVYNEERNILRLRAWEQRTQEASQAKELNPEDVPLFGEPYKTNKGDELSNRIQRMLGSYEDVNNLSSTEALHIPPYANPSQSDQGQPNTDKFAIKPPLSTQSQKASSGTGYSSQPARMPSHSHHGHPSSSSKPSLTHSQLDQSAHPPKSEVFSDLRECVSLPQGMPAQSPESKPLPFLHSSDHNNTDMDTKDTFERHQPLGSTDHPSESSSTMNVSTLNIKQSPKDVPLSQANNTNTLPSQTFPPLLSSKQPSTVMTQKPTAYVRPMDGQDHVVSESPELKPSPEPYAPLPEIINKSDMEKIKITPPYPETRTDEAQCVEDILREMTHSWPPLLTALPTPTTDKPSKPLFPAKEAEHVSSRPGQKKLDSPPVDPSHLSQQKASFSFDAAHSSAAESTSSSDSESSSGSESDSEGATEEPPPPPSVSSSVKAEPEAPAVSRVDWQLGNWIRSSQHCSSTESQSGAPVSESPSHKPTYSSVEVVNATVDSSHQKEFTDGLSIPRHCSESQQSSQKSLSAKANGCKSSRKISKPVKVERTEAAQCEEVKTTETIDSCLTDRSKVKTKTGRGKKSRESSDTKRSVKRTKNTSVDQQKAGSEPAPEVTLDLSCGHCPSCGVRHPNPCSCPTQNPAEPQQSPPVLSVRIKPKPETHKATHKHLEKSGRTAKGSRDLHRPPGPPLLVKIDLRLLSRVPQSSGFHQGPAKSSAGVVEPVGGGSNASTTHKRTKTSKKRIPQNVEADNKNPRKKQKLENKNTSQTDVSMKLECSSHLEQKKAKKNCQHAAASKDTAKSHKVCSGKTQQSSKSQDKTKKSGGQHVEHSRCGKHKRPNDSAASVPARRTLTNRPLLAFDERQYPVKHYIKEAKRLKHKADAESDKLSKAFNYLDAAMFFVESGIAMEKDPQISMSSYTMFAETVELLKFVLKLKNTADSSAPASEKDFVALCLKCQSLLQVAMFRHKHKTALKYSKMLTDHFNNSAQAAHTPPVCTPKLVDNPSPSVPSPANASGSSGPGSGPLASSSVVMPQAIQQVALTYVNITMLFLNAHDIWEQAEELVSQGSGMLAELDAVMDALSLTSSMSSMVRYTRQGVHWLRLDSQKV
ncbi:AF4/FMR2 family member 1 [Parambassis ranga]|uniref:AF4/FMR2 family member 1 n=1 Tax=Parambassis ranga TaxID=210632 RepID=A0A6P7JBH1_9TELE|nr:AF4/FMR2 family member 1-like [Parambassis ranga]